MTTARHRILQALRSRRQPGPGGLPDNPVRRFDWSPEVCLERLTSQLQAARAEIHRVGPDWPRTLFAALREKGARNLLYAPSTPPGTELGVHWPDPESIRLMPVLEPVESCRDALFAETDAALTGCRCAVAETGSLVLWPTPREPRLMSLVPPIHAVLLHEQDIRSTFHELLVEQDWAGLGMPTNALLISGPSKSADIEQTLAYGVHGPKELIVMIKAGG
jgi:L-lactate dehydrogenase complex protein LldG